MRVLRRLISPVRIHPSARMRAAVLRIQPLHLQDSRHRVVQAKQVRQVRSGPQVTSTQGNVVVEVADGKQVGYKIGDEDVIMLDEVPDALRAYTGA